MNAEKRTRTSTPLRGLEPESSASANSAISARLSNLCSSPSEVNRLIEMGSHRKRAEPQIGKEDVLRSISKSEGRSANLHQLLMEFDATPVARRQLKDILTQLVKEGKLKQHKGSRYESPSRAPLEGTILLHRDGFGFVVPAEKIHGLEGDIFIPAVLVGPAMNGDKVQVEITHRKAGGRAEGRVLSVVKRARETIVGQLRFDGQVYFVAPSDEKLPAKILIPDPPSEHKDKIVEVEITRYATAVHWPAGKVVGVIGFLDDPNVETHVIIRKFGLPTEFPPDVEKEAAELPETLKESDLQGRDDFRER